MNKEQQQIIDVAYENYFLIKSLEKGPFGISGLILLKEEFIDKIKTDSEFSEKWGLKIEERELTEKERYDIWIKNNYETGFEYDPNRPPEDYDNPYWVPTPTKLITITHNNETIEVYG